MVHCDLSTDEIERRKGLSDHARKTVCSVLDVVAEDETSIMTTYRDFYLQVSFSVLHPLMVFCMAKPLDGSTTAMNKRSNEINLKSGLGSHFINEDFNCYHYRATHWLDTKMSKRRFIEILDRCCDEAVRGYHQLAS